MIVWVAGGAGFIGSHLCELLLTDGHKVCCLDNLSSGCRENVSSLERNPNFLFVEHDICSPIEMPKLGWIPHVVYDLASFASPEDYLKYPVETILANTQGVKNLLDFCCEAGARFVYVSTSEVYGETVEGLAAIEGMPGRLDPESSRAPYYVSKALGEALTYAYRNKGLIASVARVFNTYGPRMREDDGRCVPAFISKASKSEDLIVHGTGEQTRSFCYISDTVEALRLVGLQESPVGPVNIGSDVEITIESLAKRVIVITGSSSRISNVEQRVDDPHRRRPDISKAKRVLGWSPEVSLREGLIKTIQGRVS